MYICTSLSIFTYIYICIHIYIYIYIYIVQGAHGRGHHGEEPTAGFQTLASPYVRASILHTGYVRATYVRTYSGIPQPSYVGMIKYTSPQQDAFFVLFQGVTSTRKSAYMGSTSLRGF